MEKVTLFVKKLLALILSFAPCIVLGYKEILVSNFWWIAGLAISFLLFAYLNFRITEEKPRFLFGLNQTDTYLNKKGGFWNLFKWIVISLGFIYDMVIWSSWGVFLLFHMVAELLLLIKDVLYWIVFALIWLIRQLFPPIVFIFKMIVHYLVYWPWWIYQAACRNLKISLNWNFYIIALWGAVPALFLVFLFYAISQMVGIDELVFVSAIFVLIPIVWSFGEIAALRYNKKENEEYARLKYEFRNGFDGVRSILFYVILIIIFIVAEIILNALGWIPNFSMSLLGISLNLNMALSILLIFLTVIILFVGSILPSHILYHPEHKNGIRGSIDVLNLILRRFLRYIFAQIPGSLFGGILAVIPVLIIVGAFYLTEEIKDRVLDVKISHLQEKTTGMEIKDAYDLNMQINRLKMYKKVPLEANEYFTGIMNSADEVNRLEQRIDNERQEIASRKETINNSRNIIKNQIDIAKASLTGDSLRYTLDMLSTQRIDLEENYTDWIREKTDQQDYMNKDLKELKSIRIQMPILYLFTGILFAVFGGLVFAVLVAYFGNLYYELYDFKEDESPTYWNRVISEIRSKDPNQPLLGFTLLAIIIAVVVWWLQRSGFLF